MVTVGSDAQFVSSTVGDHAIHATCAATKSSWGTAT
jgi:hypothetical protein